MKRPKLFPLRPLEIGTPQAESLSSYVCRLAEAHSLGVATLIRWVLVPEIGIEDHGKGLRYLSSSGHLVNGVGKVAKDWLEALVRLTEGIVPLIGTNLLPLNPVSTPRHLLRKNTAWCPRCLEESISRDEGPHEPLLWSVLLVRSCPKHGTLLSEICPYCKNKVPYFSANRRVGCCAVCRRWLGGEYEPLEGRPEGGAEALARTAEIVGKLLADLPSLDRKIAPESLAKGIRTTIELSSGGNLTIFARKIEKKKGAVSAWRSGKVVPSFQELVRISFATGIPLTSILTGKFPESINFQTKEAVEWVPLKKTKSGNSYKNCETALRKALRGGLERDPPPSIATITKEIGVPTRYAWLYCPDLARLVAKKRKSFLSASFKKRELSFEKELFQKVKDLQEQGVHPSLRSIGEKISRKAKLRKDQKRSLWKGDINELIILKNNKP